MTVLTNIKSQHIEKIYFVRVSYIDVLDNTQKYKFYSDSYCEIPSDLASGALISPDMRLKSIPFVLRELDVIDNNYLFKGDYSIQLENLDGALTNFFIDNVFINQPIELYVTTKANLADTWTSNSYHRIFTGKITTTTPQETISLKIKELNTLEKTAALDKFTKYDFTNQDPDLAEQNKQTIVGSILDYPVNNINNSKIDNAIFETDFISGGVVLGFTYINNIKYLQLFCLTDAKATTVAKYLSKTATLQVGNVEYQYVGKGLKGDSTDNAYFYFVNLSGYEEYIGDTLGGGVTVNTLSFKNLKNSLNSNNQFFISSNKTERRKTTDVTSWAPNSTDNYITINADWSFLQANDYIYIEKKSNNEREYFRVKSYDSVNKRVYLTNQLLNEDDYVSLFSRAETSTNYRLCFDYVQSITIEDKDKNRQTFYNRQNQIKFKTTGGVNSAFYEEDVKAKYQHTNILFTSQLSSYVGNNSSVVITISGTGTTATLATATNARGGTRYTITAGSNCTVNTVNALFPASNLSSSVTGTGTALITALAETYLYGGELVCTHFRLNIGTSTYSDTINFLTSRNDTGRSIAIVFRKSNSLPYSSVLIDYNASDFIVVTGVAGETDSQIADKLVTAINSSTYAGKIVAVRNGNFVNIKIRNLTNLPMQCSYIYPFSVGSSYSIGSITGQRAFSTRISGTDLLIDLDKIGLSLMSSNRTNERGSVLGTNGSTALNKSLISIVNNKDSFGDVGDIIEIGNRQIYDFNNGGTGTTICKIFQPISQIRTIASKAEDDDNNKTLYVDQAFTDEDASSGDPLFKSVTIPILFYKQIDPEKVYVNYKDESRHYSDMITYLMSSNVYNISQFSSTDLTTIKTNHPDFNSFFVIKENKPFFKYLSELNVSFNIVSYVDKEAKIRFKFFDIYNNTANHDLSYFNFKNDNYNVEDIKHNAVKIRVNKNFRTNEYKELEVEDAYLASIKSLTNFESLKTIDTIITDDTFFTNTYLGNTYLDLFTKKHFRKNLTITVELPLNYIELDLYDVFTISDHPTISNSNKFIITKIEINFNTMRVTGYKL
jgi:hypothetical protein